MGTCCHHYHVSQLSQERAVFVIYMWPLFCEEGTNQCSSKWQFAPLLQNKDVIKFKIH